MLLHVVQRHACLLPDHTITSEAAHISTVHKHNNIVPLTHLYTMFFHQLRHQHSTSTLFQLGLRQIGLNALKTDHLFIYFTEQSLHDGELYTSKKLLHTVCLFTIYLLPAIVVLISREIRWRRLATEVAGVDKLPDYLWSERYKKKKINFQMIKWQRSLYA